MKLQKIALICLALFSQNKIIPRSSQCNQLINGLTIPSRSNSGSSDKVTAINFDPIQTTNSNTERSKHSFVINDSDTERNQGSGIQELLATLKSSRGSSSSQLHESDYFLNDPLEQALGVAVHKGNAKDVQDMLDLAVKAGIPFNLNKPLMNGGTVLLATSGYVYDDPKYVKIIELLVEHGANVNLADPHGTTPLVNRSNL